MNIYAQLFLAAMIPVVLTALFYLLEKFSDFNKVGYLPKQIIIGVVFGVAAIVGTEWGIDVGGATANARDAAPLCAGLFFGTPAGIIAGVIGGVERWIAVAWGAGAYSRLACSISTALAGVYAAFLRKNLFEKRRPHWIMGLLTGIVMETIHLTILFLTHLEDPVKAYEIVMIVALPMFVANGLGVMLSSVLCNLIDDDRDSFLPQNTKITDTIQIGLLILIITGFFATTFLSSKIQTEFSARQTEDRLDQAIMDVKQDVEEVSDENLMNITKKITLLCTLNTSEDELLALADEYDVAEISVVDKNGIIIASTHPGYVGFDFASGEQSAEFLVLLGHVNRYIQSYQPITYDDSVSMKYAGYKLVGGGFVQVGYDADHFQKDLASIVQGVTRNRHIGENGYLIVCDSNEKIVSDPNGMEGSRIAATGLSLDQIPEDGSAFTAVINGISSVCMHMMAEGYHILAVAPYDDVYKANKLNLFVNVFMEVILFAILYILIFVMLKRLVVSKIHKVNSSLTQIAEGNLDEVVDVRSSSEFSELSDDINSTVNTLKKYISDAAARIDAELQFAKSIQASALPRVFPAFPQRKDFDVYATMDTAKEVGGDFYDYYLTGRDTFNFMIADVSGKGIPAAMFMMSAKTQLKSLTESGKAINEVFAQGNSNLCENNDAGMFVTAWQGQINLQTGHLEYANGGHNPPLVKHAGGQFEYLKSRPGLVLAAMSGIPYKKLELDLGKGDIVFLYTDGVTEATDLNNELYGEDRLLNILNSREFTDMKDICDSVKADVDAFVGEAEQFDDITMVAFIYKGTEDLPTYRSECVSTQDIPEVTAFVEAELEKMDCPMKTQMQIDIAIDELYCNIASYAYEGREPGPAEVMVGVPEGENGVEITFIDEGRPYNPLMREDPDVTLSVEERGIGGLGIYMVKKSMDDMVYEYRNDKNILRIKKLF